MLLDELFALRKAGKEERDKLLEKLDRMSEQLLSLNENSRRLLRQNEEQQKIISNLNELVEKLQKENASLREQKKLSRKGLYGPKSQKLSGKKEEVPSHEENKGDFDGTSGPSCVCGNEVDSPSQFPVKSGRPYRKGMSYKRMMADRSVCHDSDFSFLSKDAVIIGYMYINKELVDTEHLCCLAHSRAKLVYVYEQGGDLDVKYIIGCFGELYRLEDTAYLNDGRYDIDNSMAKRLHPSFGW